MSRFFDDILEDEKKDIKKKTYNDTSPKNTHKLSKKEKLYSELQIRVFDLEDNESKKSEKNVKKFLSDLKKYESSYDELPNFLKNFLLSEKVYIKGNKKVVDAFLAQYEDKKEEEVECEIKKINIKDDLEEEDYKKNQKEFAEIKSIDDLKLRRTKLDTFFVTTKSDDLKIDALVILLSTCVRLNDSSGLFEYLKILSNYLENDKVKTILRNNLDSYLEKILFVNSDEYCLLLNKFRIINHIVCDRRILEVEFFIKKKIVESEFIDFQLLSAVYKEDVKSVLNVLNMLKKCLISKADLNEKIYRQVFVDSSSDVVIYEDQIFAKIIEKCAKFTFIHKKYLHSLVCFSYVTNCLTNINLNLLCVILNEKIKETNLFQEFLLRFKGFSNNPLLLSSFNSENEIFRAFYCLHTFDIDECYNILKSLCSSWEDKEVLLETSRNIINK